MEWTRASRRRAARPAFKRVFNGSGPQRKPRSTLRGSDSVTRPARHRMVSPRATGSILAALILAPMLLVLSALSRGELQEQSTTAIPPERVRVGLVLIEVVVRDRKTRRSRDVGREQFVLHVDGKRVEQTAIPVFEETCAEQSSTAAAPAHPPAGTNDSVAAEPSDSRGLVLYFDFAQLSFAGRSNALALARAYFAGPYDGTTEVMILANASTGFQGFTTDRVTLAEAVGRMQKARETVNLEVVDEDDRFSKVLEVAGSPEVSRRCTPLRLCRVGTSARKPGRVEAGRR